MSGVAGGIGLLFENLLVDCRFGAHIRVSLFKGRVWD